MKRTLSFVKGKGSVTHNMREFKASNVDEQRIKNNIVFCNEKIEDVYVKLFKKSSLEYNAKQTRNDRMIFDYFEHIRKSKQQKLMYEIIVQIGDMEDMNAQSENGEIAKNILIDYMKKFQKRNPNLYVYSAVIHMDEQTPHLHFDFIPFSTGNKRGLEVQNSLKGALKEQGFAGGKRSETELSLWQESEKEFITEIMLEHGVERLDKGTHNKHRSVDEFKLEKRVEKLKEKEKITEEKIKLNTKKYLQIRKIEDIEVKPTLIDKSKVLVDKNEFEDLKTVAKKHVVHVSAEKKLDDENKKLKVENVSVKKQNLKITQELNEFKSVKNGLNNAKLMSKIKELENVIKVVFDYLKQKGLLSEIEEILKRKKEKYNDR